MHDWWFGVVHENEKLHTPSLWGVCVCVRACVRAREYVHSWPQIHVCRHAFQTWKGRKERHERERGSQRSDTVSHVGCVSDVAIHARLDPLLSTVDLLCCADIHTDRLLSTCLNPLSASLYSSLRPLWKKLLGHYHSTLTRSDGTLVFMWHSKVLQSIPCSTTTFVSLLFVLT